MNTDKGFIVCNTPYTPDNNPFYDGTNIIEVSRVRSIPDPYTCLFDFGVPITAVDSINTEAPFYIVGQLHPKINGKALYFRVHCRWKDEIHEVVARWCRNTRNPYPPPV